MDGRPVGFRCAFALAFLAGVSALPSAAGDPPAATTDIRLPKVGSFGSAPTGPGSVAVDVHSDGRISVGASGSLSLESLGALIAKRAAEVPEPTRDSDGASNLNVLLRADSSLPWAAVEWVMRTCAESPVKAYRIFFAVAGETAGESGAIACFLPKDGGNPSAESSSLGKSTTRVSIRMDGAPADPAVLFERLRWMEEGAIGPMQFDIDAGASGADAAPTGYVLRLVDVLLRAGAKRIAFREPPNRTRPDPSDVGSVPRALAAMKNRAVLPGITLGRMPLANPADGVPLPELPTGRRVTGVYGVTGSTSGVEPVGSAQPPPDDGAKPTPPAAGDTPSADPAGGSRPSVFPARAGHATTAVVAALRWLKAHQSPDGGWEAAGFQSYCDGKPGTIKGTAGIGRPQYDVGVTGLALLAFLGAGFTNRSEDANAFGKVVAAGLRYLKNAQDTAGCIGPRLTGHYIYNHAIASLAMVEAYGMTGSPPYRDAAQKSLDFSALARNPNFAWRYGVQPGDNDTSITGWMAMALGVARTIVAADTKSGGPATLTYDREALAGIQVWVDKMTDPKTGRVGYLTQGTGPARPTELVDAFPAEQSESMTAVGVLARIHIGQNPANSQPIQAGAFLCLQLLPAWSPSSGGLDMYFWQSASLVMWQMGGDFWDIWRKALERAAIGSQRPDGDPCGMKGSWDPLDPWGPDGGRVYSTAMMALCLEAPYRYPREFKTK